MMLRMMMMTQRSAKATSEKAAHANEFATRKAHTNFTKKAHQSTPENFPVQGVKRKLPPNFRPVVE
jgi:hypothetical protein